ncbi:MAG: choice-of-anchor N protein, partial [Rhodospirillaceae bacterium]
MKLSSLPSAAFSPLLIGASLAVAMLLAAPSAQAVPALQVYIDGATYDDAEESWKITSPSNEPLRLWVVGNIDGPGGKGPLTDVRAAFAYSSGAGNVTLNITPTT